MIISASSSIGDTYLKLLPMLLLLMMSYFDRVLHVFVLVGCDVVHCGFWQHHLPCFVVVEPVVSLNQYVCSYFESILNPPPDYAVDPNIQSKCIWLES